MGSTTGGDPEKGDLICGIAGFSAGRDDGRRSASLLASLARRGPDGSWTREHAGYRLAQTRLAVVDLSDTVSYPLGSEGGEVQLLFNGEIYGHAALRRELEGRGHRFATGCDAEVVVHAFEEWDLEAFRRLNGMFALAIVDGRDGRLVLARDRFGVKPLVRTTSGRFAFASDGMALVRAGLTAGGIDEEALAEYAAFHYVPPPLTGLRNLAQLEPGSAIVRTPDGRESEFRFAPRGMGGGAQPSDPEMTAEGALDVAVRQQLVADVNVGVLLSSGIDSAVVLACAVQAGARPRAFTLAFEGHGDYDESAGAAVLAHRLGVPHEVESFDAGFVESVRAVASAFDQPFADSSALATLQLARLARRSVTVVLSGTGGDELFAGYYRLRAHRLRPALALASRHGLLGELGSGTVVRGNERASVPRGLKSYMGRLLGVDSSDDISQYLGLVGDSTSAEGLGALRVAVDPLAVRRRVGARLGLAGPRLREPLTELQSFELRSYLPGDLLVKEDRATMSVGLEGRVPLLDGIVADVATRTPPRDRASLLKGKTVLRAVAAKKLAGLSLPRGKRGFAVPLESFFGTRWRGESVEWFADQRSELVDTLSVAQSLGAGTAIAKDVWALATLVAWEDELSRARLEAGSGG